MTRTFVSDAIFYTIWRNECSNHKNTVKRTPGNITVVSLIMLHHTVLSNGKKLNSFISKSNQLTSHLKVIWLAYQMSIFDIFYYFCDNWQFQGFYALFKLWIHNKGENLVFSTLSIPSTPPYKRKRLLEASLSVMEHFDWRELFEVNGSCVEVNTCGMLRNASEHQLRGLNFEKIMNECQVVIKPCNTLRLIITVTNDIFFQNLQYHSEMISVL